MIEGVVNAAHEAVVNLALHGSTGQTRDIEAVIDTGFTGFLTVTPALAEELGLDFRGTSRATLADGSEITFPSYSVSVLWDGQERYVEADAADTTPLVGMRLLDSHSLYVEVEDGSASSSRPGRSGSGTPRLVRDGWVAALPVKYGTIPGPEVTSRSAYGRLKRGPLNTRSILPSRSTVQSSRSPNSSGVKAATFMGPDHRLRCVTTNAS